MVDMDRGTNTWQGSLTQLQYCMGGRADERSLAQGGQGKPVGLLAYISHTASDAPCC